MVKERQGKDHWHGWLACIGRQSGSADALLFQPEEPIQCSRNREQFPPCYWLAVSQVLDVLHDERTVSMDTESTNGEWVTMAAHTETQDT